MMAWHKLHMRVQEQRCKDCVYYIKDQNHLGFVVHLILSYILVIVCLEAFRCGQVSYTTSWEAEAWLK